MTKVKSYLLFLIGLFVNSLGVSIITKASLGTSPISSIPYVLSLNFPMTLGQFTIVFSVLLVILQLIILRKRFKLEHWLQIPVSVLFGYFIDFSMNLLFFVDPKSYPMKVVALLIGCVILGFGVFLEVVANVVMLPGESFVRAITMTWNTEFGSTKICFDVSMAVIAAALSFAFSGKLNGVREGTIISALLVGYIARLFGRLRKRMTDKAAEEVAEEQERVAVGESKNVIAICREYGSGGHAIAEALAKKLGYAFYDKEVIRMTAGTTGYTEEFIEKEGRVMSSQVIFDLKNQAYGYTSEMKSPMDAIFDAECQAVRELAERGNCVIVSRCGEYTLRGKGNVLKVFLHAPYNYRVKEMMRRMNWTEEEAMENVKKEDRHRAYNYQYYTNQPFGWFKNFSLALNTEFGEEFILDMIERALKH